MRQAILTTMLISSLLMAGCGNNEAANGGAAATAETGQAATASPEVTPEVTPEPAAEATAEPAPESTAQAPAQTTAPEATPKASTAGDSQRQTYFDKLDQIETGLSDLEAMSASGVMTDMKEAASKEHERWDKALNEIYQELKQQLPEADMAKLKEEQLSWIKERDKAAEEAAAKYKGGTMEGLEYAATLASVTKERCYKLVELYMK